MIKRAISVLLAVLLVCLCAACGQSAPQEPETDSEAVQNTTEQDTAENTQDMESEETEMPSQGKILIAYFSRTGNTEALAEEIQLRTGGELFEIVPEEPYPADYDETVERFRREREENARPAIAESVEDMDSYTTVFIGFPNWGDDMPHIVYTFLEQYDFSGKTVIPFCTNGGGGFGNSIAGLRSACPDAEIAEGFECSGSNVQEETEAIEAWIASLGLEGAEISETQEEVTASNILIAYFTWAENTYVADPASVDVDATTSASVLMPGNVGLLAQWIQEETGGDVFSIVTEEPYSSDYDTCLNRAIEEHDSGARPAITGHVDNMADYDIVFLGFPNWWYSCPMAILTFIEEHDLSGKTIVPFCSHGTGGFAASLQDIGAALPDDCTVLTEFGAYRPEVAQSQDELLAWLSSLNIDYAEGGVQ